MSEVDGELVKVSKEELLRLLQTLKGDWIVSSTPFGCPEGHSKVFLRRRKIDKAWQSVRVKLPMSVCLPNEKAEELKRQIREEIRSPPQ